MPTVPKMPNSTADAPFADWTSNPFGHPAPSGTCTPIFLPDGKDGREAAREDGASSDNRAEGRGFGRGSGERRRNRQTLPLLAASAELARESIIITDAELDRPGPRIVYVNPAFTRMWGYTANDVLGKTPRILQGPRTSGAVRGRMKSTLSSGEIYRGEGVNYRKDGSEVIVDVEIVPLLGIGGAVTHFIAFQRDVTERRREEQVLAESESRYRTLVELSPDAIFVYADGRIVFANPATAKLLGAESPGKVAGLSLSDLVPTDSRDAMRRQMDLALSGHHSPSFEEQRLVRFDGATVFVESVGIPITFAGKPAVQVLFHDLTERMKLEEQFHHAQRLESIGMLAAGIAHDLNNVLAPILLAAPMLRDTAAPSDKGLLTDIEKSAVRGAGLVRQILGFARGVGGEPQIVQLKHLLDDIYSVLGRTLSKSIEIELRSPSDLWPVKVNQTQVHQVLLNLCVNARDAMPNGGTLRLSAENCALDKAGAARREPGARPGYWVVLQVQDTGTGIPADVLARIWEPFFTTKPADKGTGLGLSTVRGIVENHSGFITVQTEIGRGTTFRAYFPPAEGSFSVDAAKPFAPRGSGELVLLVDDDALVRVATTEMLTRHGYRVMVAGDGAEALVLFKARRREIDLVITDLDMPHLAGPELAAMARKVNPDVPIVAISGVQPGKDPRSPGNSMNAFLLKPFTAESMLAVVHGLLHANHPAI
jgi:two-component system, cell cycle sensor histidine kinase and response regulator CckA